MAYLRMKKKYALQPYYIGSKHGKSLAIVIPSKVVKRYRINPSTVFILKIDNRRNNVTLESILDSGLCKEGDEDEDSRN